MLTVYLDSQDYSVLSESVLKAELADVKNALLAFADSGNVRFVFSSVVVCEAVPTGPHAIPYAIKRGDLLTQLCRRNALRYPVDLFEHEVRALSERKPLMRGDIGETQDWFPPIELDEPTPLADAMRERLNEDPALKAMSRSQRRAAERKFFKNGELRPDIRSALQLAASQQYLDAIIERWPMERQHASVFQRYAMGQATKEEAAEAMSASLRDPSWLMRWFSENPELAAPLGDMVRRVGSNLGEKMRSLTELAETLKSIPEDGDVNESRWSQLPMSKRADWESRVDDQLRHFVDDVASHFSIELSSSSAHDIALFCPGIDATWRSMMSSVWDNIGGTRRQQPSDSQFPDAMHAMYAPYVDIFRADSYMAPHIDRQVKRHGTKVVAKLRDLPSVIREMLRQ